MEKEKAVEKAAQEARKKAEKAEKAKLDKATQEKETVSSELHQAQTTIK
jgi:hypothetical protein